MSSTMTKARNGLDGAVEEVQPQAVWSPGRVVMTLAVILVLLGLPPLAAASSRALMHTYLGVPGFGIAAGLGLAVVAGLVVVTRRGSGGRHRA